MDILGITKDLCFFPYYSENTRNTTGNIAPYRWMIYDSK